MGGTTERAEQNQACFTLSREPFLLSRVLLYYPNPLFSTAATCTQTITARVRSVRRSLYRATRHHIAGHRKKPESSSFSSSEAGARAVSTKATTDGTRNQEPAAVTTTFIAGPFESQLANLGKRNASAEVQDGRRSPPSRCSPSGHLSVSIFPASKSWVCQCSGHRLQRAARPTAPQADATYRCTVRRTALNAISPECDAHRLRALF